MNLEKTEENPNIENLEKIEEQTETHPNMFLNQNEINDTKNKLSSHLEPWYSAFYKKVKPKADVIKNNTNYPTAPGNYCSQACEGWTPPYPDYYNAIKMRDHVRYLSLAYVYTGDSLYANKVIDYIYNWAVKSNTKMNPKFPDYQSGIELCITMPAVFYAGDLVWNLNWTRDGIDVKNSFKEWVSKFIYSAEHDRIDLVSNQKFWLDLFVMAGCVITGDSSKIETYIAQWKKNMPKLIDSDGSIVGQRCRIRTRSYGTICDGMSYSTAGINAMITIAELGRHRGHPELYKYIASDINKWTYVHCDKNLNGPEQVGLEKSCDFYAPFCVNPQNYPYGPKWYKCIYYSGDSQYPAGNYCVVNVGGNSGCYQDMTCKRTGCTRLTVCKSDWQGQYTCVYELSSRFISPKTTYKNVLIKWGGSNNLINRYLYDDRTFGPITLTHGTALIS